MKKFLTVKDICEMMQIAESTVYYWVHEGYLPHIILKGSGKYNTIRFDADDIDKWIKGRRRETRKQLRLDSTPEQDNFKINDATSEEGR